MTRILLDRSRQAVPLVRNLRSNGADMWIVDDVPVDCDQLPVVLAGRGNNDLIGRVTMKRTGELCCGDRNPRREFDKPDARISECGVDPLPNGKR